MIFAYSMPVTEYPIRGSPGTRSTPDLPLIKRAIIDRKPIIHYTATMLRIELINENETHFVQRGDYSWGRSHKNDFIIRNATISRRHLRTWWESKSWWIQDLGSTNGTFVDGEPLKGAQPLNEKSQVQIGERVIFLTPWDMEDALPSQVLSLPIVLEPIEHTHNILGGEKEQLKTELTFFVTFDSMDSSWDFYRSDLPDLLDKMGIQGFGKKEFA